MLATLGSEVRGEEEGGGGGRVGGGQRPELFQVSMAFGTCMGLRVDKRQHQEDQEHEQVQLVEETQRGGAEGTVRLVHLRASTL